MTDTILDFNCPYCSAGYDFAEMTGYKDGRFVCRDCAHTLRPGTPTYLCTCPECLKWRRNLFVLFS
jgi:transposase-like protein